MADLHGLDDSALKNLLNQASSYEERAAIRKVIRERKAASGAGSSAKQASAGYRRTGFQDTVKTTGPLTGKKSTTASAGATKENSPLTKSKAVSETRASPIVSRTTTPASASKDKKKEEVPQGKFSESNTPRSLADNVPRSSKKVEPARPPSPVQAPARKPKVEPPRKRASPELTQPSSAHVEATVEKATKADVDVLHKTKESCKKPEKESSSIEQKTERADAEATPRSESVLTTSATNETKPESTTASDRSRHQTGGSVSSCGSILDGEDNEEEEAIERQIQSTLNYDERKRLRAKLRRLRKNAQNRSSVSSLSAPEPVKDTAPQTAPVVEEVQEQPTPRVVEEAKTEEVPKETLPEPKDETDSGHGEVEREEEEVVVRKDEEVEEEDSRPTVTGNIDNDEQSEDSAVASQNSDDSASQTSQTSQTSSVTSQSSDKRPKWTNSSDETTGKPKGALSSALSQNEGVSDFRTVLRAGDSPLPKRKEQSAPEQVDFRSNLKKKSDGSLPKSKDATDKGPRQEDFRGNLRRKVQTKDMSSAVIPKAGQQEDFRDVLKKSDKEATRSTKRTPPKEAIEEVLTKVESAPVKRASPPPPAVKSKPKVPEPKKEESSAPPPLEKKTAPKTTNGTSTDGKLTNGSASSPEKSTSTEKLVDPWDPSLTYEERVEARRRLREAKKKGLVPDTVTASPSSSSSSSRAGDSYEERRKKRQEEKIRQEEEQRKKRQQFTQQLNASSPDSSPSKNYQRSTSGVSQLLEWCRRKTVKYDNVEIKDFKHSWKDGLAFAALVHNFCPGDVPYDELTIATRERNFTVAFEAAEKSGLPAMLDVEDMMICSIPDEKSVITYVASIYKHFT